MMESVLENISTVNQIMNLDVTPNILLIDTVINGVLVVIALYLFLALVFHTVRIEKPRKQRFRQLSIESKYGVLSKYSCILIAVASLLRHSTSFARNWINLNINRTQSQDSLMSACRSLPQFGDFALTFGIGLVFQFLWFRQRVFYIHPSLKILSNKCVKFFSFAVMIMWLLFYIPLYPAYFSLVNFQYVMNQGCVPHESSVAPYEEIIIVWTATSFLMQISLLFLFVYPILKCTLWQDQKRENRSNTLLMKRVKKAVILASVCFLTDLLTILAVIFVFTPSSNAPAPIFDFGVNLLINHLVTIACFDHWKQLLWPWTLTDARISRRRKKDVTSTEINPRSTQQTTALY